MSSSTIAATPRGWTWRDWVTLAARLVLGGVLLVAGLLKIGNLASSAVAVRAFQIFPFELATAIGYVLPPVEIVIGLLLILGLFTRISGALGALMMLAYIAGIISVWARHLSIDCGCFGGGGGKPVFDPGSYALDIARDLGLMICGAWAAWHPRSPFALERKLFGDPITIDEE